MAACDGCCTKPSSRGFRRKRHRQMGRNKWARVVLETEMKLPTDREMKRAMLEKVGDLHQVAISCSTVQLIFCVEICG